MPITEEQLKEAAKSFAKDTKQEKPRDQNGNKMDVGAYLAAYNRDYKVKANGSSTLFCLARCVFDESHVNESSIGQAHDGTLFYQCFHDSCKDKKWHDAKEIISGTDSLKEFLPQFSRAATDGNKDTKAQPFEFIHNAELVENLRPVEWRIHGIMEDNAFYYNFGAAGSYKTFVELDRLLSIAAGIDYHGHSVKQGTVFYIAGEGQQGLGRRIAAWHIHHGTKAREVPFFVAKTPTQLMDLGAVDDVKRAVDRLAAEYGLPAIIHIDTLARNFGEGDENATADMNRVISNIDTAFGAGVGRGLTHHSGHGNKNRARGAYALHGAADAAFRIEHRSDGKILVEAKKAKDAPLALPMLFNRLEIKLVIGDYYDSSCVLELDAEGDEVCILPENKISPNMDNALYVLNQMYSDYEKKLTASGRENDRPSVSKRDWRTTCLQKRVYSQRFNFERAVERMALRNLIVFDQNEYYVYPTEIYRKYYDCDS